MHDKKIMAFLYVQCGFFIGSILEQNYGAHHYYELKPIKPQI